MKKAAQITAHVSRQLAPNEIQRLNAVRALVDHCNTGVTGILLNPVVPDVTMTAVNLNGHLCGVVTGFRKIGFHERCQQLNEIIRRLALLRIFGSVSNIDIAANPDRKRSTPLGKCTHRQQHAPDIRMNQQRVRRLVGVLGAAERAPLLAVFRILDGGLVGAFSQTEALDADAEACVIHHREHRPHPFVRFANEPSCYVLETHLAGSRGFNPHFVLDTGATHRVAVADIAIFIRQKFGHQKKTDPLDARRCIGQSRQHQVDNVFRQVMFAGRDKDLGTGQLM